MTLIDTEQRTENREQRTENREHPSSLITYHSSLFPAHSQSTILVIALSAMYRPDPRIYGACPVQSYFMWPHLSVPALQFTIYYLLFT
ncbi:hypothetical protein LR032_01560, partial [Candidatus Bipolaricaulota bacterium]|nr:hypothetical protein [Candidatus Bipolaricaulota bacterium]